jgi:hypothetical protein
VGRTAPIASVATKATFMGSGVADLAPESVTIQAGEYLPEVLAQV